MPATYHNRLFHPRLVRERVAAVPPALFDQHRKTIGIWLGHLRSGALADTNEVKLHGGFLERIFGDVLGYRTMARATDDTWDLEAEKHMDAGGSADGAIGMFSKGKAHVVAPIELKGAAQSLDQAKGRSLTPVQQGWDYANKSPSSRWIIVSNYVETRLYAVGAGQGPYEDFQLEELESPEGFARFVGLLGRESVLGGTTPDSSPLRQLLIASQNADQAVTSEFYERYREIRIKLFEELVRIHSNIPAEELVGHAQKILDRVLFLAFAEDRGLVEPNTVAKAFAHRDPYKPRPVWENFLAVFRAVDSGNPILGIPAYNGGLFKPDPAVEQLELSDAACEWFKDLAKYDFRDDVSVDVLGHVFEQSISDLEELRSQADAYRATGKVDRKSGDGDTQKRPSKRRAAGIFYTPPFITSFLVRETVGRAFSEAWERAKQGKGTSKKDRIATWENYQDELRSMRILDPACGSGAFLIAAFDAMAHEFERANKGLAEINLQQASLFDLNKSVLNENLFGIDLNGESVEITRLSLWLKTAQRDRKLTFLDRNIRQGNSVVSDPLVDPHAFDWKLGRLAQSFLEEPHAEAEAIDARWREGFDVVIGNPPYVRQELLGAYKDHWKKEFEAFDGVADLFVYFFERGIQVLKPGGRLGFIVSNKWLRGGYAENLRGLFAKKVTIERVVDFGHAPIFPDADAFPSIIVLRKNEPEVGHAVYVTNYPREELNKDMLPGYVESHRFELPQVKLGREGWSLEPPAVGALMEKIRKAGVPLAEYAGCKPYRGVLTGCNEAFLVDDETRKRLCKEDPRSKEVLKKYLRGQDIKRWAPSWAGLWMIFARRGIEIDNYPAIKAHLEQYRQQLEPRPRDYSGKEWPGRKPGSYKWYELQDAVDYFELFEQPKLLWKDIAFYSDFAISSDGIFTNDLCFILPSTDKWLLACLNSPAMWAWLWRNTLHGKDEALRLKNIYTNALPVASGTTEQRIRVEQTVADITAAAIEDHCATSALLDLLRTEYGVDSPGNALSDPASLSSDAFIAEVKKRRPKSQRWTSAELKHLRELYENDVEPMQDRQAEILKLERLIAAEVHKAYGLTPEDEQLLWETAPPRMPVGRP